MDTIKITVKAMINGSPENIWKFYTSPEHITNWNFADDSWCCPSAKNELKIGGRYVARMEAKDGSAGFDFEAVYTEVVDNKKLSYLMTDGRIAHVTFNHLDNGTMVEVTFDSESENPVEMQRAGWQAILNNFKKYAESQ